MFTPKNIQGALEELYDLCDPDYMVDMLVNYSEEFDDISPALLAKSFQKNAEMISEYRVWRKSGRLSQAEPKRRHRSSGTHKKSDNSKDRLGKPSGLFT